MAGIKKYRYVTPIKRGRWYDTREEARQAAAKAGCAHIDEWGHFWFDIFTKIETKELPPN